MRILNLSLDKRIIERDSAVQRRLIALAEKTGEITVLVPGERNRIEQLSEHLLCQFVGGVKFFQFLKLWSKSSKALRAKRYDLITVQDAYFLGFLGYKLSLRFKIPLEIQVHGLERFFGIRKQIAGFVLLKAQKIRVVSERLRRFLNSEFNIQNSKIYVLPVYTQREAPKSSTKRKTIPYPFTFLTVGRLVPVKNISLQIRAFAKIAKEVPHVRLRIVGSGPERTNLQLETRSLKLEASVVFEGEQGNIDRFYEEADAFLLTSDSEGWGLVALEAAAHRLPIIMTDVGLAREVIHNEESGFIIPVGDEHELVLAMQEFLDKPELRARLGEGAYRAFRALPESDEHIQKQIEEWRTQLNRK